MRPQTLSRNQELASWKLPQFPAFYLEGNERHMALMTAAFAKTEFCYCGFRIRVEQPARALQLPLPGVLFLSLPCFQPDSDGEPEGTGLGATALGSVPLYLCLSQHTEVESCLGLWWCLLYQQLCG